MKVYEKNQQLFPLRDVVHSLQFTFYWFQAAEKELAVLQGSPLDHSVEGEGLTREVLPTLIGTQAYIDYLKEQLAILSDATNTLIDSTPFPPGVENKLRQAYNRLMEGLFSAEISNLYYGEFNRARTQSGPR
jgi:hypothetical protein